MQVSESSFVPERSIPHSTWTLGRAHIVGSEYVGRNKTHKTPHLFDASPALGRPGARQVRHEIVRIEVNRRSYCSSDVFPQLSWALDRSPLESLSWESLGGVLARSCSGRLSRKQASVPHLAHRSCPLGALAGSAVRSSPRARSLGQGDRREDAEPGFPLSPPRPSSFLCSFCRQLSRASCQGHGSGH